MAGGSGGTSLIASGGVFTLSMKINSSAVSSGQIVSIFRSSDANTWILNTPTSTCTLDSNLMCTFTSDHLSYFGFTRTTSITTITTSTGPGGGGGSNAAEFGSNLPLGLPALLMLLNGKKPAIENIEVPVQENTTIVPIDIKNNSHKNAILLFIKKGYIKGSLLFRPIKTMTRAEFIKIVALANNFVEPTDSMIQFNDVSRNSDAAKYIQFA